MCPTMFVLTLQGYHLEGKNRSLIQSSQTFGETKTKKNWLIDQKEKKKFGNVILHGTGSVALHDIITHEQLSRP